jgi:glycosyltransferase involved in cell wall biosynthesis
MKQTLDQIKAFEIAKESIPELQLKVSGSSSGEYGAKVLEYIENSPYSADIEYLGRTTDEQKIELMQRCHAIMVSSIKEGWGLIVSETNSQGTPAVVYDADGLRDSVKHMGTGIVTAKNPVALAQGVVQLLSDQNLYRKLQTNAWQWSRQITFKKSYNDFKEAVA